MISADLLVAKETGTKPEPEIKQLFQWQIYEQGKELGPDCAAGNKQPFQVRFGDIKEKEEIMKIAEEARRKLRGGPQRAEWNGQWH